MPEKQTVEDQYRSAATVAKTVAKPLNNTRRTWTTLEYRPSPRPVTDGPGRRAHSYGSEGWGFESLRARQCIRRSRPYCQGSSRAWLFVLGPAVSQFLTVLSDLMDLGECGLAALQVFLARVDVGLLCERRVVVTSPLADDGDRHARVQQRRAPVPQIMQPEPVQASPPPGHHTWW